MHLHPRTQTALHTIDCSDIIEIVVQLLGYQWSSPIRVPQLERSASGLAHDGYGYDMKLLKLVIIDQLTRLPRSECPRLFDWDL